MRQYLVKMCQQNGVASHGLRLECHFDVNRYMKCLQKIWLMEDDERESKMYYFTFCFPFIIATLQIHFVEITCVIFKAVHFELLTFHFF